MFLDKLIWRAECPECGVPRWVCESARWTSDGLLAFSMAGYIAPPSIVIEVDEYKNIFQSLQETLGFNIDRIITEAQRKNVKAWFGNTVANYPGFLLRNKLVKTFIMKAWVLLSSMAGYGRAEIYSLDPDTHILYRGHNYYSMPMAIGDGQGFFEAFYGGTTIAYGIEMTEGEYLVTCARTDRLSELEDRLEYVPRKSIPGSVRFEPCPQCGIPIQAMNYRWEWNKGILINKLTGQREMVCPSSGLVAICRELTEELGGEIPDLLIDDERRFTTDRLEKFGLLLSSTDDSQLKEGTLENLQILLAALPLRGMGNPVDLSFKKGVLKLRVENPFLEPLICGKVLGYYEALEETEGRLEWEVPEGEWAVEIKISPG